MRMYAYICVYMRIYAHARADPKWERKCTQKVSKIRHFLRALLLSKTIISDPFIAGFKNTR